MIKQMIQSVLVRYPKIYLRILRAFGRAGMEKRVFLALCRRGDIIFDIGANRGVFTRLFSDIASVPGRVHAFEPVSSTFEMLRRASGLLSNVTLNHCALGESEGVVQLYQPGGDDGQSSRRLQEGGASWQPGVKVHHFECRMTTLDVYAVSIPRIDFLKCDVEGAEGLVIAGAIHVLEQLSPLLFFEVYPLWLKTFDYTAADLFADLQRCGYDTFYLVTDLGVTSIAEWPDVSGNLIAAKRTTHATRLAALALI